MPPVPEYLLRWRCSAGQLAFRSTDELDPCRVIIGQERALKAIRLGLEIDSLGYNLFVTGLIGTGRNTTIKALLEEIERIPKPLEDICYVNNFKNPDMPQVLVLTAGQGRRFKKDMEVLIGTLRREIPQMFESTAYQSRRKEVVEGFREQQKGRIQEFETRVSEKGFVVVQLQLGPYSKPELVPAVGGNPVDFVQLEAQVAAGKFSAETLSRLKESYEELSAELQGILKEMRKVEKDVVQALSELDRQWLTPLFGEAIGEVRDKYANDKLAAYLEEVRENLMENLVQFQDKGEGDRPVPGGAAAGPDRFAPYRVNLLVDNSESPGVPVVTENSPSYKNLFGSVERAVDRGGLVKSDFSMIKAGSFLRANGGYLVINAADALQEPGVWVALKRALRSRTVEIQSYDPFYLFTTSTLKPEAIETRIKVVMIGDDPLYHLLYNLDSDFRKIFKVKADFGTLMDNSPENVRQYACFVRKICLEDRLLPFDSGGVGALVEYGVRLAGRQNKLTTQFNEIADLVREADYWARKDGSSVVREEHVDRALEEKVYRVNLIEERIQEMIADGTILIDTESAVVGQVNGLSVHDMGDYAFGRPSRITARVALGRAGIINIEREAALSGSTHDKGVLILTGYLRGKYAQDKPLSISGSICFEQSYSGVDGDSASSTEMYALLSVLAKLPIRQEIAVTGSMNQKGELQPIGGVNQKVEGFYDVCRAKGLTGTQGVLIPRGNIPNLMLRKDVLEAVREGKFHIHAAASIDEGIEVLTGIPAGESGLDGTYPPDSVHGRVESRMREMAALLKGFAAGGEADRH